MPRVIEMDRAIDPRWKAVAAPSVSGGHWVLYGLARWPSYSYMLCPGTFEPERW